MDKSEQINVDARLGGGPHGVGDPNDQSLRKLERDVLIPKKIRERIKNEKCAKEFRDFLNCSKEAGLLNVIKCRSQNKIMLECSERWFNDEGLVSQCTKEYLHERTYFRQHGVPTEEVSKTLRYKPRGQKLNQA